MSTLTIRVCEECGAQSVTADGWLVMENINIRQAKTGCSVLQSDESVDLCSPGCVLRYISRCLEPAMNGHSASCRSRVETAEQPVKVYI